MQPGPFNLNKVVTGGEPGVDWSSLVPGGALTRNFDADTITAVGDMT